MTTNEFKNKIYPLTAFEFTEKTSVWMIPTHRNGLKEITQYNIIGYQITKLGLRIELAIHKKQKGIESIYAATASMIGEYIFLNKDEADKKNAKRERWLKIIEPHKTKQAQQNKTNSEVPSDIK